MCLSHKRFKQDPDLSRPYSQTHLCVQKSSNSTGGDKVVICMYIYIYIYIYVCVCVFISVQLTPQQQSAEPRNGAGAEALAAARRPKEASFVLV